MSKVMNACACDRCKSLYVPQRLTTSVLVRLTVNAVTKDLDLCPKCSNEIMDLLGDNRKEDEKMSDKFVDFAKYCPKCKHWSLPEEGTPCDECLEHAANEDSHKPVRFEGTEKGSAQE